MSGSLLTDLGVGEAAALIRRGDVTAVDVVGACLTRIDALEPALQAWAYLDRDGAMAAARDRDAAMRAGAPLGPLHGVPLGIKDIIDVAGMPTTAGAAPFAHTHPTNDASLVARLRQAGAVIVGKTQATQFAYRDPAPTRNPWSAAHTPGGSSSGSAAAVAARMVPGAIGTQTVGSILRPAAYCGVVGLKGSHGQVPLDGVVPLAWSLDHAGPLARSVADAGSMMSVLTGGAIEPSAIEAPRLAVSPDLLDRADPALRRDLDDVLARLRHRGAILAEITLPTTLAQVQIAGAVILEAEAAAYHAATYAEHASEYGPAIGSLVVAGLARSPAEVEDADRVRIAFREAIEPILEPFDALLTPTAPGVAPPLGEGTGDGSLCAPWSYAGVPSISIPTGVDAAGLPFAIQLVQGRRGLAWLLGAAAWCERVIGFDRRPAG